VEPDLKKIPYHPDEDILLFIRDHNPHLAEWEKDLLTIVHEQAQYFIPQIETKIMNEGWASFWHKRIFEALDPPQRLRLEFIVRHTQVICPTPYGLNPYHVGMKIWEDIEKRWDKGRFGPKYELCPANERDDWDTKTMKGMDKIFMVREVERDSSFLRRFLTEDLVRELKLFEYQFKGNDRVVSRVADEDNWQAIKNTLIQNVGTGTIPVIKVEDADYNGSRTLFLKHAHDGRDLQLEYAENTLKYVQRLWGHEVVLETTVNEKPTLLCFANDKLTTKSTQ